MENELNEENILAENDIASVWVDEEESVNVFVNYKNLTISMNEQEFFSFVKLLQSAAKKMLGIK